MLLHEGWSWRELPTRSADRAALLYGPGDKHVWYSQSLTPHRLYLTCLLSAESIFRQGIPAIQHYSPQAGNYYASLLKGQMPDVPVLALCNDIMIDDDEAERF